MIRGSETSSEIHKHEWSVVHSMVHDTLFGLYKYPIAHKKNIRIGKINYPTGVMWDGTWVPPMPTQLK